MGVCTNKQDYLATDLLKKIKINHFFEYVAGSNTFDYCKPDPRHLTSVLEILDGDIKKSDILDRNNKYNTYMINGLPPTPISISSISSINASIDSLPGDYLFFVADSKTSHYFSKTYEEHLNKINELGLNK